MDIPQLPNVPPESSAPNPAGIKGAIAAIFGGGKAAAAPVLPPDPYADNKALLETFKLAYRQCFDRRQMFEMIWWRNLLYALGRQWIYYDRASGQWLDKRLQKWIPKPVTNKIAETVAAIMSVFGSVDLSADCKPVGGNPKDVQAAETANRYEGPLRVEHDMERVETEGDFWLVTLGNVFWHLWWDVNGGGTFTLIPNEQCLTCTKVWTPVEIKNAGNVCPECGMNTFEDATDDDGQPVGTRINQGRGRTDAVSPLEIAMPSVYTMFDDTPVLIRVRWRTEEYCTDNYPAEFLSTIAWESASSEHTLQLYRGLSAATEIGSMPGGSNTGSGGSGNGDQKGVTEYELWMKPCRKYAKGLVLRVCGDGENAQIVPLKEQGLPGPLPVVTPQGERVWPWVHIPYEHFGGRLWARSPLEHLIEKQNQLNQIDSLMQLIIQRTANPVWLEPKGSEVKKFTGEPGLVVKYNPLIAGGNAKPERIEGAQVPSSLVTIREMILSDIENLAGTYDIIKGQKPTGVEAFSALQLLVERSQSRYGPVLANRGRGYRRWFQIAIEMERQFGPKERAEAVLGPNGAYTQATFKQIDLAGAMRVEVEDGSQMPKTSLGKRAAIEQLRNFGVIDPRNPDTAYRILQIFGATDLWPGLDYDVKSALQEQDAFEQWAMTAEFAPQPLMGPTGAVVMDPVSGQPAPAGPPVANTPPPGQNEVWFNQAVHIAEHKKWANGDAMQQLMKEKPDLKQYVTWMIQQHEAVLAQQAQDAAMAAAGPVGAGSDGKGVAGGRAMSNSNAESGDTSAVPSGNGNGQPGTGPM
jgi:hypothetical protein